PPPPASAARVEPSTGAGPGSVRPPLPPLSPLPPRRAIPPAPPTPEPPTRRKTLIVGPPPPGAPASSAEALAPASLRLPSSQRLPTIDEPALSWSAGRLVSTPPGALPAPSVFPPPSAAHFAKAAALVAPGDGAVSQHASGVIVARPTVAVPFATRLESIRAMSGALDSKILERKQRGASLGETFGGLGSPLVELVGEGHLVVGPKPGHTLWTFTLDGAPCSAREDRVLGFQLSLSYENERVALGPTELRVVRFAGAGAVVLETSSALVTLGVTPASGIVVRREVVVGWLGILDITPVLPADAPGAHHGLVRFQGEGSVLVSGL
ncbi:MAG TPA: AIM24 family protein, partial [Polyangiaceae bacterium]|nr:AIM24 family protein [Polyangiaceae bacterium]